LCFLCSGKKIEGDVWAGDWIVLKKPRSTAGSIVQFKYCLRVKLDQGGNKTNSSKQFYFVCEGLDGLSIQPMSNLQQILDPEDQSFAEPFTPATVCYCCLPLTLVYCISSTHIFVGRGDGGAKQLLGVSAAGTVPAHTNTQRRNLHRQRAQGTHNLVAVGWLQECIATNFGGRGL